MNILLARLENSTGITILTTNLAAVLDPALDRRLTARLAWSAFSLPATFSVVATSLTAERHTMGIGLQSMVRRVPKRRLAT